MEHLDILKENALQFASIVAPWQWALVVLGGYKIWRSYQQYIPIPVYGGIVSFSRILSTIRISRRCPEIFAQVHSKYPMILLPRIERWVVFVQPQFLDELLKAPDETLSFLGSALDTFQLEYTFGKTFSKNQDHQAVIQNQLTRHLTTLFPEVLDEVQLALNESLSTQEWQKVHAFPWILQIVARASNRVFVGAPLCRDRKWLDFNINGPPEIMGFGTLLDLFPRWMLPVIGPLLGPGNRRTRKAEKMVGPLIEARLNMDPSQRPNDFVTWLLTSAPESERTVDGITRRLLIVNFVAIHTSSVSLGHMLYWLLARPKYIAPLREEVEETVGRLGWTKDAIGQMPRLESFMKECLRMSPVGALALTRKVLKPFTFSNGVTLPAGTHVTGHLHGTHYDGSLYEHHGEFDGFRFIDEEPKNEIGAEKAVHKPRQTMYSTSKTYLSFGHGRHACPGRFFASMELKMIMAYLLVNYDMKWPEEDIPSNLSATEEGYRPPDLWFNFNIVPNQNAHMMIRKRV